MPDSKSRKKNLVSKKRPNKKNKKEKKKND
jgi:hypothetical protein